MSRSIVPIPLFRHVGFTGTRKGLTRPQRNQLRRLFETFLSVEVQLHHGACHGADLQAHEEVERIVGARSVAHPSTLQSVEEILKHTFYDIRERKPPLIRNHDIVDSCHYLIACPSGYEEERRSGTWATIRYARSVGRLTTIVWPHGRMDTYHFLKGDTACRHPLA